MFRSILSTRFVRRPEMVPTRGRYNSSGAGRPPRRSMLESVELGFAQATRHRDRSEGDTGRIEMKFSRITHDPKVMGGKPCIRGLRMTVGTVVGLLGTGESRERILQAY